MRIKFTVIFDARYKYTCNDRDEAGEPRHEKNELSFRSNYYYLGDRIDDCLRAFWAFVCYHGYANKLKKAKKHMKDTYLFVKSFVKKNLMIIPVDIVTR